MDLGLGSLTDDQLLELLQQACGELMMRDPFVRNIAQATIFDEAQKLVVMKNELEVGVRKVRADYEAHVRNEVLAELRKGLENGTVRLLSPEQEAKLAAEAELEGKMKLIDEEVDALKAGGKGPWQP